MEKAFVRVAPTSGYGSQKKSGKKRLLNLPFGNRRETNLLRKLGARSHLLRKLKQEAILLRKLQQGPSSLENYNKGLSSLENYSKGPSSLENYNKGPSFLEIYKQEDCPLSLKSESQFQEKVWTPLEVLAIYFVMKQEQTFLILFRIAILPDGSLRILNASKADEGKYICQGENIFGSAEIIASLSVKVDDVLGSDYTNACVFTTIEPTRIELTPKRTELTVGESIVLNCKAIHDSSLDVTFYWTLKGQPIDFEKEGGHFENIRAVLPRAVFLQQEVKTGPDNFCNSSQLKFQSNPFL
ncbi:hypothetical protein ACRRTK_004193 [Alexandromys fortis]